MVIRLACSFNFERTRIKGPDLSGLCNNLSKLHGRLSHILYLQKFPAMTSSS